MTAHVPETARTNWKKLAADVMVPVLGGSLAGWLANRNTQDRYNKLEKPSFSPAPSVFPIAWTALYGLMGYAKYRADRQTPPAMKAKVLTPYELQLGLNYIWSFLFFKWNLRGTALIEMTVLLAMISLTAYEFQKVDSAAGKLLLPYIGWVSFAWTLNYSIWKLNRN
ncbi:MULTISPECIES: TspO/MBR family protein [Sporosarcina]|uniref:TspO/MBR family protein n=1 Tax=Sporosarcina TaxID=1569 RepID=UPI0005901630|nr:MULTISPECIES: TspO/MBR family protein [Sporosarcina]WJY27862.1 TspO/MBR family protein [Sporosarcina sp. 0.2-SM1T-5]